jgi:hypothetical protein
MQSLPVALSGADLESVMTAAAPIQPQDRDGFLQAICAELAKYPEVGPGLILRVIRQTQREYFDPPDLRGSVSKHDR